MGAIEHFSTRVVPRERRHLFWRDVVADAFPGMTAYADEGIRADLFRWSLGGVGMARAISARAHVSRLANKEEHNLLVHLAKRGRMTLACEDRVASVAMGDFVITDDRFPYSFDISAGNDCMIVQVPARLFGPKLDLEAMHGRVIEGGSANADFLSHMISSLWSRPDMRDELDPGFGEVVADAVEVLLQGYTPRRDDEGKETPVEFVLAHLSDPALGTAMICDATGLSSRGVQKAFLKATGRTPTAFITERRLEHAAELLLGGADRSITEIAFDVGYNDASFFSRRFRDRFGVSPREFRQRGQEG